MERMSDRFDVKGDAKRVFEAVRDGGVAICHYDLSYAIICATDDALRRVYAAKNRSYDRASGVMGSFEIHDAIHILPERERRMIRAITVDHDLPLSVIAPFDPNHRYMKALSPFLFEMATRDGTVNFLLNAGELRDEVVELAWKANVPLVASSANASLKGTKYRMEDIEPEVRAVADVKIDYGPSKFMQAKSISSTQIDFRTMKVVRFGTCYEQISNILRNEFGRELPPNPFKEETPIAASN